jgi:hypothetical protein
MLKRLTRVTSHSILRLLMFSVMLFLSVLYIHGFIGKYSEISTETHSKPEQQKETAQQVRRYKYYPLIYNIIGGIL